VLIETETRPDEADLISLINNTIHENQKYTIGKISQEIKHVLSHQRIFSRIVHISSENIPEKLLKEGYKICKKEEIDEYPLPRLLEKYLDSHSI